MRHALLSTLVALILLGLHQVRVHAASLPQPASDADSTRELDRAAILAMAGEYRVEFHFRETLALSPGYELRKPHVEYANETVVVLENQPDRIVLQHILVLPVEGKDEFRVVKHWRQDWRYEPTTTWQFLGDRTWARRALSSDESAGRWVQEVYQVDDSPRYASLGAWIHAADASAVDVIGSSWEGEAVARPLPRREWKARNDYQLLIGRNRHTLTPTGWVHEQDNTKIVTGGPDRAERKLAREHGHNTYDRLGKGIATETNVSFNPGYDYWRRTSSFWAQVRAEWSDRLLQTSPIRLVATVDDKPMWRHFFDKASEAPTGETARMFARATVDRFVNTSAPEGVARD